MKLTRYTDYALRVLLYLGASDDRRCSIGEIARGYRISENHLMKVVQDLGRMGLVATSRGRGGGIRLARPPEEIRVGDVVRRTETDMDLADCEGCVISPVCGLVGVFDEAVMAFMAVLDRYTIADLLARRGDMLRLLGALTPAEAVL